MSNPIFTEAYKNVVIAVVTGVKSVNIYKRYTLNRILIVRQITESEFSFLQPAQN